MKIVPIWNKDTNFYLKNEDLPKLQTADAKTRNNDRELKAGAKL